MASDLTMGPWYKKVFKDGLNRLGSCFQLKEHQKRHSRRSQSTRNHKISITFISQRACQPTSTSIMDFDFESEQERKALTASDEAIYPELRTTFKASLTDVGEYPMRVCSDLQVVESLVGNYDRRPGRLPLTSHDLQDFIGEGFASLDRCFNILWNNGTKWETDIIHGDGFHSVICFRTIEFMVRPLHALNADDPTRLL